jgi:hypothetical protein
LQAVQRFGRVSDFARNSQVVVEKLDQTV